MLLSTAISGEDIWEDSGEDDVIWFFSNFLCSMGLSEVWGIKWYIALTMKASFMSKGLLLYLQQLTKHVRVNVIAKMFLTQKVSVT